MTEIDTEQSIKFATVKNCSAKKVDILSSFQLKIILFSVIADQLHPFSSFFNINIMANKYVL